MERAIKRPLPHNFELLLKSRALPVPASGLFPGQTPRGNHGRRANHWRQGTLGSRHSSYRRVHIHATVLGPLLAASAGDCWRCTSQAREGITGRALDCSGRLPGTRPQLCCSRSTGAARQRGIRVKRQRSSSNIAASNAGHTGLALRRGPGDIHGDNTNIGRRLPVTTHSRPNLRVSRALVDRTDIGRDRGRDDKALIVAKQTIRIEEATGLSSMLRCREARPLRCRACCTE